MRLSVARDTIDRKRTRIGSIVWFSRHAWSPDCLQRQPSPCVFSAAEQRSRRQYPHSETRHSVRVAHTLPIAASCTCMTATLTFHRLFPVTSPLSPFARTSPLFMCVVHPWCTTAPLTLPGFACAHNTGCAHNTPTHTPTFSCDRGCTKKRPNEKKSDGCDKVVEGKVYACGECFGYDLCERCYGGGGNSHARQTGHTFQSPEEKG